MLDMQKELEIRRWNNLAKEAVNDEGGQSLWGRHL